MPARTPEDRSLVAQIAAAERWGRTPDRTAATEPAAVVRRERKPMSEAEAFKPSTFASRKAQPERNLTALARQRVVSLGGTEFSQRNQRTGDVEFLDAELFMDLDKPMRRYVEIDGVPGRISLQGDDHPTDQETRLPGTVKLRGRGASGLSLPSQPDPPPRAV